MVLMHAILDKEVTISNQMVRWHRANGFMILPIKLGII